MTGILKQPGAFAITPHKVSLCILLKIYAPPAQISVPFPFSSVSQHNRLGLFLLALTKVQFSYSLSSIIFKYLLLYCIVLYVCYVISCVNYKHCEFCSHVMIFWSQNWMNLSIN